MIQPGPVAIFTPGKGAQEADDPLEEQQAQRQNCAELNDDRVHFPVRVVERNPHQCFSNAQMRR